MGSSGLYTPHASLSTIGLGGLRHTRFYFKKKAQVRGPCASVSQIFSGIRFYYIPALLRMVIICEIIIVSWGWVSSNSSIVS